MKTAFSEWFMRFSEVYAVYAVYAVYGGLCGLVSPHMAITHSIFIKSKLLLKNAQKKPLCLIVKEPLFLPLS